MFHDTPLSIIDSQDDLVRLAERLANARVIGVDTESDSFYHYREKVCLIQFSDPDGDYIVDPLKIEDLSPLNRVFSDRNVVKVVHGGDYDVVCMKRDFNLELHNLFDTLIAAQLVGLEKLGLADLIDRFFGIPIEKKYQRHDWSKRPLLPEHVEYARGDTHWLLALHEILTVRLKRARRIAHHTEECDLLERREWHERAFDPDGYLRIRNSSGLEDHQKRVLRRTFLYRNEQAKQHDRPAFKVIPDSMLIKIASELPQTSGEFIALFPKSSSIRRRHSSSLLACVTDGLTDDFPIPNVPRRAKQRKTKAQTPLRISSRAAERALAELKAWRNTLCNENAYYTPMTVASNATLKAIAQFRPTNLEELASVSEVRRWQVAELGAQILSVLDATTPHPMEEKARRAQKGKRRNRR